MRGVADTVLRVPVQQPVAQNFHNSGVLPFTSSSHVDGVNIHLPYLLALPLRYVIAFLSHGFRSSSLMTLFLCDIESCRWSSCICATVLTVCMGNMVTRVRLPWVPASHNNTRTHPTHGCSFALTFPSARHCGTSHLVL